MLEGQNYEKAEELLVTANMHCYCRKQNNLAKCWEDFGDPLKKNNIYLDSKVKGCIFQ